jgi:hypothetical protein
MLQATTIPDPYFPDLVSNARVAFWQRPERYSMCVDELCGTQRKALQSFFTTHHSPLTTHHSPLTTHALSK